jgi:hypothetical protein
VEDGRKPETLVARKGMGGLLGLTDPKPQQQRLLCAYPAEALLKPGANPDKASSYACQVRREAARR